MELRLFWTVARRELREALRNKWLWLYAAGFAALALALSRAGLSAAGYSGLGGFGRTAASLINALLLFVPLMGLSVGAAALAGDRERGTLLYLLAQPVSRAQGLGAAGLALAAAGGGSASIYLALAGYTLLLALTALGLGLALSALTRKAATAAGAALVAWLGLVFFADLGLVGATLALRPPPSGLLAWVLVNPLQTFKLGAIYSLHATLDTLGPAGQYAVYRFGDALPILLIGVLAAWCAASFGAAWLLFARRGDA